jgi:hypothetical protein
VFYFIINTPQMKCMRIFSFIILFLFFPLYYADAMPTPIPDTMQTGTVIDKVTSSTKLFWLTLGGGIIGPGIGGDLKATYAWGSESISAKICAASELSIFGSSNDQIVEYGLYYGAQEYNFWGLLRAAAGPSYFAGYKNQTDKIHNFGIGAEAEAMLKLEVIGISLMVNTMISTKFFYGGIALNVNLGKLN